MGEKKNDKISRIEHLNIYNHFNSIKIKKKCIVMKIMEYFCDFYFRFWSLDYLIKNKN